MSLTKPAPPGTLFLFSSFASLHEEEPFAFGIVLSNGDEESVTFIFDQHHYWWSKKERTRGLCIIPNYMLSENDGNFTKLNSVEDYEKIRRR